MITEKKYNIVSQQYATRQSITVDKFCNSWAARCLGDTPVTVNGILLQPSPVPGQAGESVSVGANEGEIYSGRLDVIFQPPAGTNPLVEVVQKFYLPENFVQK